MGKKKQKGTKVKETTAPLHSSPTPGPKNKPIGQKQIVPFDLNVVYQALRLTPIFALVLTVISI